MSVEPMCEPCCHEDCEHTDGAEGLRAERDEAIAECDDLRAQLAAAIKERDEAILVRNERWARHKEINARLLTVETERDRLRAALAAVVEVSDSEDATMDTHFEVLEMARSMLAAVREKAGLP